MTTSSTAGPLASGWLATIGEAVTVFARHRSHALLILCDGASASVAQGVLLEGRLSTPLLLAIFAPDSQNPLRSGAVVIRSGVVERIGVPFMRSAGWHWIGQLAQEVRAVVISVAEEDGLVRVATPVSGVQIIEPSALARHLADTASAKDEAHAE